MQTAVSYPPVETSTPKGKAVSKGDKRRGNREAKKPKKPKKPKEKVVATAMFSKANPEPSASGKKRKKEQ
jgi:hypothetical protein